MTHAVADNGSTRLPSRSQHRHLAWGWLFFPLTLSRVLMVVLLAELAAVVAAQDVSPLRPGTPPDPLQRSFHWIGSGRFQYDGMPSALAINPSGTLLLVSGECFSGPLLLYSIPDGTPVPLPVDPSDPSTADDPVYPSGCVHWIDDRHIIVCGVRSVSDLDTHDLALPFTCTQRDAYDPLLQIIDIVTGVRRSVPLPEGSSAGSFVLSPDGSQACFICPQLPSLIFPIDEDARPNQGPPYGMGIVSLQSGAVRRGFCPFPFNRRVAFLAYQLSNDGRFLIVMVQQFMRRHSAPPTIQLWDVALGTLLHSVPVMTSELLCDIRSGRNADQVELLWVDPAHGFAPTMTTVSMSSGAQRESPGWTIVGTGPDAGHILATIGASAVMLPDHRSISIHGRGIPEPLPWADPSRRGIGVNARIACDRGGHYYALAGGNCVDLLDVRHAVRRPQPDAALWCRPSQCAYLEDDTLAIISQEHMAMERPDGQLTRVLLPKTLEMASMKTFGGAVVTGNLASQNHVQQAVFWDACRQRILRPLCGIVDLSKVEISAHQQFAAYQQDLGQIVLADLLQPSRPEAVISAADGRSGSSFVTWSDDESLVCVTRTYQDALTMRGYSHAASAWDTRTGRQRWIACSTSGWMLEHVTMMIPDCHADHILALEEPSPIAATPPVPRFLQSPTEETPSTIPTLLLDGHSGRVVRQLDFPGRDLAFTPDSTRIVGGYYVIDIRNNHQVQEMPSAWSRDAYFDLTPSHTWALVGSGSD